MGFLTPGQANALVSDGAYIVPVAAPAGLPTKGPASSTLAIVGAFTDGPPNTPTLVTVSSAVGTGNATAAFGTGIVNGAIMPNSGIRELVSALPECTQFLLTRAVDGTQTSAVLRLLDNTASPSTGTLVVGGTWQSGKPLSVTLTSQAGTVDTVNYTTGSNGDTSLPTLAAQLLAAINASPGVASSNPFLANTQVSGNTLTFTSAATGPAQNNITVSAVATGSTITLTPGNAGAFAGATNAGTLLALTMINPGSNANGVTGRIDLVSGQITNKPVLRVTVNYPNNVQSVYSGIVAYSNIGFDPVAFKANALAQINGTAPNKIASALFVATTGASTAQPQLATFFQATGGTDGVAGLTSTVMIGTDAISGRTGMYSLRGQSFGALILAGVTDPTIDTTIQTFLSQVGGVAGCAYPAGTGTTAALAVNAANNLQNSRVIRIEDWLYGPDTLSGQRSVLFSPLGKFMGLVCSVPPYADISNKPQNATAGNILGTERTVNAQPIDPQSEGATRKANGINYITNQAPRSNGQFGIAHGLASDGSSVSDTRMFDYVASLVLQILARYVGKSQLPPVTSGFDPDPVRKACRDDFTALNVFLTGGATPQMAGFSAVFAGSAAQVASGYFPWNVNGQTLAGIQFAIANLAVGVNVTP